MGNRWLPSVETSRNKISSRSVSLFLPNLAHLLMLLHWLPRVALLLYIQPLALASFEGWEFHWEELSSVEIIFWPMAKEFCHSFSKDILIQIKRAWQGSIPASATNTNPAQTMELSGSAPGFLCQHLLLKGAHWRWGLVHPLPSLRHTWATAETLMTLHKYLTPAVSPSKVLKPTLPF